MNVVPARGGTNSLVYLVHIGDEPKAVVYLVDRYKNWSDMRDALALGETHDLPLPRLLHSAGGPINALLGRYHFLATDFASGTALNRVVRTPAIIDLIADTLARLHTPQSETWGKARRPQTGSIREDWHATISKRLAGLRASPPPPDPSLLDRIQGWFEAELAALPEPRSFQLCHHHLAGDDMLLSPDGSNITLIDCGDLQFSRAARDLACIHQGFFPDDRRQDWSRFLARYFSHFSPATREEWERELPLFDALYLLFKVRSGVGKRRYPVFLRRLLSVCGLPAPES